MNYLKTGEVRRSLDPQRVFGCFHSLHQLFLASVVLDTPEPVPPFEEAEITAVRAFKQTHLKFPKISACTVLDTQHLAQ